MLVPAFIAIALVFAYLNTPAHELVDPLIARIG